MRGELGAAHERAVLIVEDAESCAATLEIAFYAIPDLQVLHAATALQALEILRRAANGNIVALVTDLNLPRMDGFELIRQVRDDTRYRRLPVIVVSGDTDPHTPDRIFRLGADAYFAKPYSPAQVRGKLEQLINADSSPPR